MRAVLLLVVLLLTGCSADGPDRTSVRVAAASNLEPALEALRPLLRDDGVGLEATYGSSGSFVQQLVNGARFDVFLSADADFPRRVVAEGLAEDDDLFAYAVGRSVLWLGEGSPLDPADGLRLLTRSGVRKVAIANPETAPYGRAAVAALRAAGVHDQVRPKLVLGENVAQAADFVVSGGADAGIVPRSLVVSPRLRGTGRWVELVEAPGLEQVGVLLSDSAAARALRDLLLDERGRRVLAAAGYDLPEP